MQLGRALGQRVAPPLVDNPFMLLRKPTVRILERMLNRAKAREERPERKEQPPQRAESSPVIEDIKSDWNGPLPSFLSKSAG